MLGEHGGVVAKDLPYPASTRIPMMMRWPGHVRRGRTTDRLVANIDVAPTLLEAAGTCAGAPTASSLLDPDRREALLLESRGSLQRGPRAAPARLPLGAHADLPLHRVLPAQHVRPASSASTTTSTTDPWELDNRADDARRRAGRRQLSRQLQDYGTCQRAECP